MTLAAAAPGALKIGLIGGNISASQSPRLHRLAGVQTGLAVTYELLIPQALGKSFDQVFAECRQSGYRGVNITYPFKEQVVAKITTADPVLVAMGAVNTVLFQPDGPQGYNTDYSGFMAAYSGVRGAQAPGRVLLIGTGGVGRAVAFGLARLGAAELVLLDRDRTKAQGLAQDLSAVFPALAIDIRDTAPGDCTGVVNCTPVGMIGLGGMPVDPAAMTGAEWVFDAVYTPTDTPFLQQAAALGLTIVSGWELFFFQGVDAWALFSGRPVDQPALRKALQQTEPAT